MLAVFVGIRALGNFWSRILVLMLRKDVPLSDENQVKDMYDKVGQE